MRRINWYAVAVLALCVLSAVVTVILVHWIVGLVAEAFL